jgi:putative thioredoxin
MYLLPRYTRQRSYLLEGNPVISFWSEIMMTQDDIIDVSEVDFEYEVIDYSQNTPVVVDFIADWKPASLEMSRMLVSLAREANGAFRLAHVDVDRNPNLAILFGVRSVPTVKAFSGGEIVAEFSGIQPENRVREFLMDIEPPSPAALALEKGFGLLAAEDWAGAEDLFREALDTSNAVDVSLFGLVRALIPQGKAHEALAILSAFPPSRLYPHAEAIKPLASALQDLPLHQPGDDEDDTAAAYWNAVRLVSRGNIPAALDGLLDLLRQNKRDSRARQLMLALFELLGEESELTSDYRKELSALLF